VDVRVDASVRDEAEEVDVSATPEGGAEHGVGEEGAVLDRPVDAHQVLVEDAAGADRQVPHLRVAHLPGRQPDRLPGGFERRMRVVAPQPVEDGCRGEGDRVARAGRRAAPAVENDEDYRAARQMRRKESGSSEAPPTSAPSTSGWARRPAAFSGLTEPP